MEQFPATEPYESGMLTVGDGHAMYWEVCGNPDGVPALYLHGGPGSGSSVGQRRWFDPQAYRAVLIDQRGSGRSWPLASKPVVDLSTNTTQHLIADIEQLREQLGVDAWVILGLSWGTTLGLAYALAHPTRVRGLVLGLVTTGSRDEVRWITEDVGRIFPEEWDAFTGHIPEQLRHLPLLDAYAALLEDPDPAVHDPAARAWCNWEDAHVSLTPGHQPNPRYNDPEYRLRFARLVVHYWRHACFLGESDILDQAANLNGIPGVLIHGRYDISGPLVTAWDLAKIWTTSDLVVLEDAGHGGGETLVTAILRGLARFASPPA